ncbi:MAG: PAS domain-containing protein [Anaerolineales bacterium]|nr:PAS domain-containing protein [Anaerolineales bacterium]
MTPEQLQRLVHELQVHQIELELQNEELQRIQQEFEASRDKYFDLYDMAPVGYVTMSAKGLIEGANLTLSTLLGVNKLNLVKRPLDRFVVSEDQNVFYLHRRLVDETGKRQTCELRMVRQGGDPFWVSIETIVRQDALGALPYYWITVTDVSERKRAEAALAKSEAMYRLLADHSSDTVSLIDAGGTVIYISPSNVRRLGYDESDLVGLDTPGILQRIHPDDRAGIAAEIKRGRELKLPASQYEYRIMTKRGDYIWLEDVLHREFDEHGEFVRTIVNSRRFRDASRRKKSCGE